MKRNLPYIVAGIGMFLLGYGVHYLFPHAIETPFNEVHQNGSHQYINPLLSCADNSSAVLPNAVKGMEEDVHAFLEIKKEAGILDTYGVYYRDLNNGPWFGINASTEFSPGSLLKVPLLMSLYRATIADPALLSKEVEFEGKVDATEQMIVTEEPILSGHTYTVEELGRHMIIDSDNNAALLLYQILGYDKVAETYRDLGENPPTTGNDYLITVRGYASFFRILYNATYLTADQSERALKLLAGSSYKDALVAGVPSGTPIAHKFGERKFTNTNQRQQLHDCGIVYAPKHPYILCVMTQGSSVAELSPIIAEVSRIVYQKSIQ
jgi:beta-lactamase class A